MICLLKKNLGEWAKDVFMSVPLIIQLHTHTPKKDFKMEF